ncbi:MAG: DNA polymerase I, partial [Eggerthellaceae bacterium]|nr:DNA polymerase I [Eggerthellaceae bacterium]
FPVGSLEKLPFTSEELCSAKYFDCSVAAYCVQSNLKSYDLEALCMKYLDFSLPEPGKDEKRAASFYAQLTRMLKAKLDEALKAHNSCELYEKFDMPIIAVLSEMERSGVAIDVDLLAKLSKDTHVKLNNLEEEIYIMAGQCFNILSPKQVGHILFEVLGLPAKKKTKTGYSTNHELLEELAFSHPIAQKVLEYRELAKMTNTYLDTLPKMRALDGDQRIHCSFNQTVTKTGRLSSSDPNLQNIPIRTEFGREVRKCFLPLGSDEIIVSADYSQIELRLLAHLSGDESLIEAFKSGKDFHASTAAKIFGLGMCDVDNTLRSQAKAVNFGIVYGQKAFGLSKALGISFYKAQQFIDKYFETYPKVREFLDNTVEESRKNSYASTMFGRRRYIPELFSGNSALRKFGERTAMNHPMQGSAADIIKLAMNEIFKKLYSGKFESKMILQVHDELCFSAKKSELEKLESMVKDSMENVVKLKVPLVVDINHAANWA